MAYTGRNVRPLATLTGASISDGTVDTVDIADAAITAAKVAANGLAANTYGAKSISTAAIADAAVTSAKIAASTINANNIATLTSNITLDGADLLLGDTDKIRLGDSQDLEIYHDASNSIINDNGTGSIQLAVGGTAALTVDSSRNVGIGGAAPSGYRLEITQNTAADLLLRTYNSDTTSTSDVIHQYRVNNDAASIYIQFGDATSASAGQIQYNNSADSWTWSIGGASKFLMESDGDFHADGDVIAYSTSVSDERLKEDITLVDNALEKVNQLKGVTFKYKTDGKVSAGVIAQDVEKVLPEAVTEKEIPLKMNDGEAYKTVRYDALHALLIEAIKELSAEVKLLKEGK